MFSNLRADAVRLRREGAREFGIYVLEGLLFDNGFQAVVCYRIARWFKERGIPFFGPLVARFGTFLTGAEISPGAEIGPGLQVSHGYGLVVGGYARIGSGALLLHEVTIGSASPKNVREMPRIGDDVFVGAGAKVIGGITVGDRVVIGVDAVVMEDVPDDSTVVATTGIEIRDRRNPRRTPPTDNT